jgi:MerR family transcriptional regulator, light-induced transcriptional regulator
MSEIPVYDRRRELASLIRQHRSDIAQRVTNQFLERHPDWVERYGDLARERGVEDALFHVDFLAGAVESGSPGAFPDYARWTAGVLEARGIAPRFLVENLEQVRDLLAERMPDGDRDFVRSTVDAGLAGIRDNQAIEAPDAIPSGPGSDLPLSRSMYLQAILDGDRRAAMAVVTEALHSHPVTSIYRDIVEAAQIEIGSLWAGNRITVAREHMATAVSQYVLSHIYSRLPAPEQAFGKAVVTGVEGELHQLGGHMVADILEAEGWSVRFLGTQMPHRDIVKAVEAHEAKAVGISTTMLFNLSSAADLIRELRAAGGPGLKIVVGGRAFSASPELWRELGADGMGTNLDQALETFRRLVA